jgi:hypothetical protein
MADPSVYRDISSFKTPLFSISFAKSGTQAHWYEEVEQGQR